MSTFTPDRATPQSDDEALTAQQMQQAEELLFSEPPREGFADRHGFWGAYTDVSRCNTRLDGHKFFVGSKLLLSPCSSASSPERRARGRTGP